MAEQCNKDSKDERPPYFSIAVGNIALKFGGKEIVSILIALIIGGPIAFGIFLHDQKQVGATAHIMGKLSEIKDYMQAQTEAQDATNYILTLSQEDREKLNLNKPKRIRNMERD